MEEKKKHIVTVTRKKKEEKKKHIVCISKPSKKREKEIKDIPSKHTIQVLSFKKFKETYMKDVDEEPNEYIRKMTKEILHCWYFYKTDIYDDKEKIDYITQILKTIKYNDYLSIFIELTYSKLVYLGILDEMMEAVKKLNNILQYLVLEQSVKLKVRYTFGEIRDAIYKKTYSYSEYMSSIENNYRYIAMKDSRKVIETNMEIQPSKELKGCKILVETKINNFIAVPYMYYKRLFNIAYMEVSIKISDIDLVGERSEDEREVEFINKKYTLKSIQEILAFITKYRNTWEGLNLLNNSYLENNWCIHVLPSLENFKVYYKDGDEEEFKNYVAFCRRFLDFIEQI